MRTRRRSRKGKNCFRDAPSSSESTRTTSKSVCFARTTTKSVRFAETSITSSSAGPAKSILNPQPETSPRCKRLQQRKQERALNNKPQKRTRKRKRPRPDFHFAPPSTVRGIPKWWELSIGELTGQILINLTWYQYFNVCQYNHVHKILTDDHKTLPIVNDLAILKLVSRTGNFIPTPSANQLVCNVRR